MYSSHPLPQRFSISAKLALGRFHVAELQVGFPEIFPHQRVVRVDAQRFLVVAKADGHAAELAVRITEVVEDLGIVLVGREAEHRDRLLIAARERQLAAVE